MDLIILVRRTALVAAVALVPVSLSAAPMAAGDAKAVPTSHPMAHRHHRRTHMAAAPMAEHAMAAPANGAMAPSPMSSSSGAMSSDAMSSGAMAH